MHNTDTLLQLSQYETQLHAALEPLGQGHRIAFAAWCCERLYPWYQALAAFGEFSDAAVLRMIVDEVWTCARGGSIDESRVKALQMKCDALELGDEGASIFRMAAMDAVGAAMLSLDVCKSATPRAVVKVGQCTIDVLHGAIMAVVWQLCNRPLKPGDVALVEKQMSLHPSVLRELRRQSKAIALLQRASSVDRETVRELVELAE